MEVRIPPGPGASLSLGPFPDQSGKGNRYKTTGLLCSKFIKRVQRKTEKAVPPNCYSWVRISGDSMADFNTARVFICIFIL